MTAAYRGEVARYIRSYGTDLVSKAVFAGAVPPYLYKSEDNPDGGLDDAAIEGGPHGFNATHADAFNRALIEFLDN